MAAKRKRTGVEWVGGLVSLPTYVTGEGEPYRPEALVWMDAGGYVLGFTAGEPGTLLGQVCESLQGVIDEPMVGPRRVPARMRVASAALAEALRAGWPGLDVVCAPTPEVDTLLAGMRERLGDAGEDAQSYLSPETPAEAIGSLFRAAAALFRAKPWEVVPDDACVFSVTIERLGVRDAVLSVIGQMGESLGLVLFDGIEGFEAFLDAADALEHGEEPQLPPHLALNFERGAQLGPALRKEIAEHRWEVAGPDAYPLLMVVDEDCVGRPPTAREVTLVEAIALAMAELLSSKEAVLAASEGGEPISRSVSVLTHAGELDVVLRVPFEAEPAQSRPAHDVLARLFDLAQSGDELDSEARRRLDGELLRRFAASPEGKAISGVRYCPLVMDLAAGHLGATISTLGPFDLDEILFEIIPRKVSIDASTAGSIIEEMRAFYTFLGRDLGLQQASSCLEVLGTPAAARLEDALSDRRNFGIAKSVVMAGRDAGFDMGSQDGIEAWMRIVQGHSLSPPARLEPRDATPRRGSAAKRARKSKARARKKKR